VGKFAPAKVGKIQSALTTLSDADIEITWRAAGWPTLVGDIFNGQQPKTLSIRWLKTNELPWEWEAQRVFFGKFDV